MSITSSPAAIIFVNNDLSASVQATIERQLMITETMTGNIFDSRVAADGYYVASIHGAGLRILVIRDFTDLTNRNLADIVIFISGGMAAIESNNIGPPRFSIELERMYLSQLIYYKQN